MIISVLKVPSIKFHWFQQSNHQGNRIQSFVILTRKSCLKKSNRTRTGTICHHFFNGKNHYYLHNVLDKAMLSSCGKAEPKKEFPVLFIYWTLPVWSLQSLPVFCENNGETLQIYTTTISSHWTGSTIYSVFLS